MATEIHAFLLQFDPLVVLTSVGMSWVFANLIYAFATSRLHPPSKKQNIPPVSPHRWPLIGSLQFLISPWLFAQDSVKSLDSTIFSFNLTDRLFITMVGENLRKWMFEAGKQFDLEAGHRALVGIPDPDKGIANETLDNAEAKIPIKRLVAMIRPDKLEAALPQFLEDIDKYFQALPDEGIMDPEISENEPRLRKVARLFLQLESPVGASGILFPWIPSPAKIMRTIAGARLYFIFKGIISNRRKTGVVEEDPLQFLLSCGDDEMTIVKTVLGTLFAGQTNSGILIGYTTVLMLQNPSVLAQARKEIIDLSLPYRDVSNSTVDALKGVPLREWEDGLETIDLALKEGIRLFLTGHAYRQNIGSDCPLQVEDKLYTLPHKAILAYPLADVHMDPNIYPNPMDFDISRYSRGEGSSIPYGYLGWGMGRHPCLGMRLAKLLEKLVTAFFIANFDLEVVTKTGEPSDFVPRPDVRVQGTRPPNAQERAKCHIKYRKVKS
ncbi:cytochrome P450 [Atractiella rhizophila]|nr:cytochrome P450 [Atractiella rhizophila]